MYHLIKSALLTIVCLLPLVAQAQVIDVQALLLQATGLEPYEMEGMRAEVISPEGHVAGTWLSAADPALRGIYVLYKQETGGYAVYLLGYLTNARIGGFLPDGSLLVNAHDMAGKPKVYHFNSIEDGRLEPQRMAEPATLYPLPFQAATVSKVRGGLVALNTQLTGLRTDRPLPANAYAKDIPLHFKRPGSCNRGVVFAPATNRYIEQAFPMAVTLNADSHVYDLLANGTACGSSKAFAGKQYLRAAFPFYATPDSAYLVLPGLQGRATACNENGLVAGVYVDAQNGQERGFVWDFNERNNDRDGWVVLRNNRPAIPEAMNAAGQVVGSDQGQAFVWVKSNFYYIDDLMQSHAQFGGWQFTALHDVNDAGQAVGEVLVNGAQKAVVVNLEGLLRPMEQ